MRKITFQVSVLLSLAGIILQMSGCTTLISSPLKAPLIGLGTGVIVDVMEPLQTTIFNWSEIGNIRPGNKVSVKFKDGRLIEGIFTGFKPAPSEEYAKKYAVSREQRKDTRLPGLGEKLTILMTSGNRWEIEFLGFDLTEAGQASVLTGSPGQGTAAKVPFALIEEIRPKDGDALNLGRISGLLTAGQIPFSSGIGVAAKRGDEISNAIFPLTEIKQIDVTNVKRGWLKGFLIGGAIELFMICGLGVLFGL